MNFSGGSVIKISAIFCVSLLGLIFLIFFYQSNKQVKDIRKIQKLVSYERMSNAVGDKETMKLISHAKEDDKITNKEFELIKESFEKFIPLHQGNLESGQKREKEFMEKRAQRVDSQNNSQPQS